MRRWIPSKGDIGSGDSGNQLLLRPRKHVRQGMAPRDEIDKHQPRGLPVVPEDDLQFWQPAGGPGHSI